MYINPRKFWKINIAQTFEIINHFVLTNIDFMGNNMVHSRYKIKFDALIHVSEIMFYYILTTYLAKRFIL